MNDVINILLNRRINETSELTIKTRKLFHNSKKNHAKIPSFQEEYQFVLVPSREVLIKRIKKAIDNTQTSINVSTSWKRFNFVCYALTECLMKAWLRGVKGRVIIEETEESYLEFVKDCWKSPSAEIRFTPTTPKTVMVMYDKKEVFIYVDSEANLEDSPALWSNNPGLVTLAEDHFETLWSIAHPTRFTF